MTELKLSFLGQRKRSTTDAQRTPLDEIAEQVRSVYEAAQRASDEIARRATELGADGDRDAERRLLAELAESVVARTARIRADCDELSALLQRARRAVAQDSESANAPASAARDPSAAHTRASATADWAVVRDVVAAVPDPVEAGARGRSGGTEIVTSDEEDPRLAATKMAIAGWIRDEIAQRLREEYGIEDAEPMLDEIYGEPSRRSAG